MLSILTLYSSRRLTARCTRGIDKIVRRVPVSAPTMAALAPREYMIGGEIGRSGWSAENGEIGIQASVNREGKTLESHHISCTHGDW